MSQINSMSSEGRETVISTLNTITQLNLNTTSQVDVNTILVLDTVLNQEMERLSNASQSPIAQWNNRSGISDSSWLVVSDIMDNIFKKQLNSTINLPTLSCSEVIRNIGRGYLDSLIPATSVKLTKDTFTVSAYSFNTPSDINNITLKGQNGSVFLPPNGFFNSNVSSPIGLIYSETPKLMYQAVSASFKLRSPVIISLSTYDLNSRTLLNVSNLESPIQLSFQQVNNPIYPNSQILCYYYNTSINLFSKRGMTLVSKNISGNSVTCASTHLTDFVVLEMPIQLNNIGSIWRKAGILL